ncbi:MAG: CvfD/Ygs/GSP13 family RNA-binding post-transcriptional regulator [Bacilli bacterium]|nr:CvfD/Ygs/GSP13 family RNA-binding post-transcriptional regulator [Bacilli bacterium]
MKEFKEKDIIKAKVTGIQEYGAFVNIDNEHDGLIHISEISYGYVKNINDYVKIGDKIYAEIINVDDKTNQLRLSIKDIDYKNDGSRLKRIAETKSGFEPLKDNLDEWINRKIKEIMEKM